MPSYTTLEKLKLLSDYQDSSQTLTVFADYRAVRPRTVSNWIRRFLAARLAVIQRPQRNHSYSIRIKRKAVEEYQLGRLSNHEILAKYHIRNISQLRQWLIQYNSGKLTATNGARKRGRKMGCKVTYEEKIRIVKWVLEHEYDYTGASNEFDVSYQRIYSWVRKYLLSDDDWTVLKDRRGKNRNKEPKTELEKLRQEVRRLKEIDRQRRLEIAFAKKLVEIRNRGVQRSDDIKRFKK